MLGVFVGLGIDPRRPRPTTPAVLAVLGGIAMVAIRDSAPLALVLMAARHCRRRDRRRVCRLAARRAGRFRARAAGVRHRLAAAARRRRRVRVAVGGVCRAARRDCVELRRRPRQSAHRAASRLLPASASRRDAPGGRRIDHVFDRGARGAGDRGGVPRGRPACHRSVSRVGRCGGDRSGARRVPGSRCGDSTGRRRAHRRRDGGDSPAWAGGAGRRARHGARARLHARSSRW